MKWRKMIQLARMRKEAKRLKRVPVTSQGATFALLHQPTPTPSLLAAGILGGGIANTLYQLTLQPDPVEALHIFEQRYPKEFESLSSVEWHDKLEAMSNREDVLMGYVNGYSGYQAETAAFHHLEQMGYTPYRPTDVNHPHADLYITEESGQIIPIQVKTYASESRFLDVIEDKREHVQHFMVNEELYEQLQHSGQLNSLAQEGIVVWNGEYSNEMLRNEALSSLGQLPTSDVISEAFQDGALVSLPILSIAAATYRIIQIQRNHKLSTSEKTGGSAGEFVKVGTRTTGGWIGFTVSSGIATALTLPFAPGVGLVGSIWGIGVGNRIGKRVQLNWQYSRLMKTYHQINEYMAQGFPPFVRQWIIEQALQRDTVIERLHSVKRELTLYRDELDPTHPTEPTMRAILLEAYADHLTRYLETLPEQLISMENEIFSMLKRLQQRSQAIDSLQLQGEWLAQLMLDIYEYVPKSSYPLLSEYLQAVKKHPNHPFRLAFSPTSDLLDRGYRRQGGLT